MPRSRFCLHAIFALLQDGICDKNNAPSVSSISRLLRGGQADLVAAMPSSTSTSAAEEAARATNHSIDGILRGGGECVCVSASQHASSSTVLSRSSSSPSSASPAARPTFFAVVVGVPFPVIYTLHLHFVFFYGTKRSLSLSGRRDFLTGFSVFTALHVSLWP